MRAFAALFILLVASISAPATAGPGIVCNVYELQGAVPNVPATQWVQQDTSPYVWVKEYHTDAAPLGPKWHVEAPCVIIIIILKCLADPTNCATSDYTIYGIADMVYDRDGKTIVMDSGAAVPAQQMTAAEFLGVYG